MRPVIESKDCSMTYSTLRTMCDMKRWCDVGRMADLFTPSELCQDALDVTGRCQATGINKAW